MAPSSNVGVSYGTLAPVLMFRIYKLSGVRVSSLSRRRLNSDVDGQSRRTQGNIIGLAGYLDLLNNERERGGVGISGADEKPSRQHQGEDAQR